MRRLAAVLCTLSLGVLSIHGQENYRGKLRMRTSDQALLAGFDWARQQALAYAFQGGPVGDWYEAALPGREAFCMRDVSHQCMGAHALGLANHTRNMMFRFAKAISEARDWCGFWEINRYGQPATVDYQNNSEFWYNLPANFDLLDACYRMHKWTGDRTYLTDPAFVRFYKRTVHDYVKRWDLGPDTIMTRQRIMNVRGRYYPANRFQKNRGIPSYEESNTDFVAAVDLLAAQYAGYLAYARIQQLRGKPEDAGVMLARAREVAALLDGVWWDPANHGFYSHVDLQRKLVFRGFGSNASVLYYGAVKDPAKVAATVDGILRQAAAKMPGIEGQSHLPEILYRYGKAQAAYGQILDLTREGKPRREYPEVSYAVVGAVVTGLMGIDVEEADPSQALTWSLYVDRAVRTLPRLTERTAWAELEHVPVRSNDLSVRHEGTKKTTLANQSGPALSWKACLPGSFDKLLVDGEAIEAQAQSETYEGRVSCVTLDVGARNTRTVQAPR